MWVRHQARKRMKGGCWCNISLWEYVCSLSGGCLAWQGVAIALKCGATKAQFDATVSVPSSIVKLVAYSSVFSIWLFELFILNQSWTCVSSFSWICEWVVGVLVAVLSVSNITAFWFAFLMNDMNSGLIHSQRLKQLYMYLSFKCYFLGHELNAGGHSPYSSWRAGDNVHTHTTYHAQWGSAEELDAKSGVFCSLSIQTVLCTIVTLGVLNASCTNSCAQ